MVNYLAEDLHFFLKKIVFIRSLQPKLIMINMPRTHYLDPYFLRKVADELEVPIALLREEDKNHLLSLMKVGKRQVLDDVKVGIRITADTTLYGWGSV